MTRIGRVIGWFGRQSLLFLLLLAALIAHQLLRPSYRSYQRLATSAAQLQAGARRLALVTQSAVAESDRSITGAAGWTVAALDRRLEDARRVQRSTGETCGSDLRAVFRGGAVAVVENRRACLARTLREREIAALAELRATADLRRPNETVDAAVHRHVAVMRKAAADNRAALSSVRDLSRSPYGRFANGAKIAAATARADQTERAYTGAKRDALRLITAGQRMQAARTNAIKVVTDAQAELRSFADRRASDLGGTAIGRARSFATRVDLAGKARAAAAALALILAMPFLIRLFCYYVLAPLATRRRDIRLRVPGGDVPVPLSSPSTTSVAIRLLPGEELLVRQDYLQSTSHEGAKETQWFLDWRHPITSVASRLTFLTRIRGVGEVTTVSAVRDPFAEVTLLALPVGAACVLQPRALAAVAQPIGAPLRVTSHWRLGSLNAWLTLQLRYLVFHGPVRLVVKGGRGVRVEPAEHGRIFGQDQLVGFSADLAYAVTRTETFWPYFLGREPLLKDRVAGGDGVLIVEEAPLAGRRGGVRHGIEGLIDAGMKVFGM